MLEAEARIATNESSRLLTELALAWVHSFPVRYDAITAEVELPGGDLVMTADGDSLSLRLVGRQEEDFEAAKQTIAEHVERAAGSDFQIRCLWNRLS